MLPISLWLIYLINYVSMEKIEVSNNNVRRDKDSKSPIVGYCLEIHVVITFQ